MSQKDLHTDWTEVIKPQGKLLDLRLRDIWSYRDLLFLFVKRDFIAQYKQTILGPLWHVIQPVFTTVMFMMVFSKIANIPTDGITPILFYMSGITIWNYFASCLGATSNTFVGNASIFGKVYFPRLILPLSIVFSNMVKFAIQFVLLLLVIFYYHFNGQPIHFGVSWLLIPYLAILMAGIGLGLGIIISALTTKYRDLTVLVGFGVQLLMYATPIAYPMSFLLGKSYGNVIQYNPLSAIAEGFRFALFERGGFEISSLAYSTGFMIITMIIGLITFNKVEKSFMDTV